MYILRISKDVRALFYCQLVKIKYVCFSILSHRGSHRVTEYDFDIKIIDNFR